MTRQNCSIIFLALARVHSKYSSPALSLAKQFAKENKVYYINHPYSIKDFVKQVFSDGRLKKMSWRLITGKVTYEQSEMENLVSVTPPLTLPINWLPPSYLYRLMQRVNNYIILRVVKKILRDHNIEDFIYLNSYDPFFLGFLPEKVGAKVSIYQSIDDISQNPYTAKHGEKLEEIAAENADMVITTSNELKKKLSAFNSNSRVVHNAVDISIFEKTLTSDFERPEEIKNVKGKIIGFTGHLDSLRIDFKLLKLIAEHHSDKTLLLVGPISGNEFYDYGIDKMENVISTGAKPITELPRYVKFMDVVLIPFLINKLTASIYPLKVNEYLAAGRTVISTNFSEDINLFKDIISIVDSDQEFLDSIDKYINQVDDDAISKRVDVAKSNTWEIRVKEIWKLSEVNN